MTQPRWSTPRHALTRRACVEGKAPAFWEGGGAKDDAEGGPDRAWLRLAPWLAFQSRTAPFLAAQKEDVVHQIKREVEIHYRCRHKNIVRMHCYFQTADKSACGVCCVLGTSSATPLPLLAVFLVLEYANGGTLYDLLQNSPQGYLDEATAASFLCQMLE